MAEARILHLPGSGSTPGLEPGPAPLGGWAELHCHSSMSYLQGADDVGDLVDEAARLGIGTLAITDRDGLYAARRHTAAARAAGIATVVGAELTLPQLGPVLVLARDLAGFSRLSQAITTGQLAGSKGHPRYDLASLGEAHGGRWTVLTGCPAPGLSPTAAVRRLEQLADLFGPGNTVAELVDHRLPVDGARNDALAAAAARLGLAAAVTGAVHYARPGSARVAQAMAALRRREGLEHAASHLMPAPTAHLHSEAEMRRLFARYPQALQASVELGAELALDLTQLRPQLPGANVPPGHDEDSWLRTLAEQGAQRRYGPRSAPGAAAAWRQLDHELDVISQLGMSGYFLTVHDIVSWANKQDIWCQGRGSAANSVVCHVIGITGVDPIKHDLLFERFLSPERDGSPDIDVDFEHNRREEVLQNVFRTYSREHAAQVANIITYRPRLALRDAARALGYPVGQADAISRHVHHHEPPGPDAPVPDDVRWLASRLDGLPRHLGVHSGGMVLSRQPIAQIMPVEWATAEDRSVLQGDKEDVAQAGLIKIDLLGLGSISALHDACRMIAHHHGVTLDLATIPQDDPAVFQDICKGDTIGVFQLESRAMISTLPRLKPRRLSDLVVAVSLIRPGPIQGGSVHPYLRRRAGREAVTYPHPLAEKALKRSLGVALWQEQMMSLAVDCAGFTAGQADQLRSAMGSKRSREKVAALTRQLMDGMAAKGIGENAAREIHDMISAFSGYGFPESHAHSLAHISAAGAWVRHHYPTAFVAGILSNLPMGFYNSLSLIGDARRHGVVVRGVDVLHSGVRAGLEADPSAPQGVAVRLGLGDVRYLGTEHAQRIVEARRREPFTDLEDFARRTDVPERALESLASCGAFTGLGLHRRAALWTVGMLARTALDTLRGTTPGLTAPDLPVMTPIEKTRADLWATGTTPGPHPVHYERPALDAASARSAAQVRALADKTLVTMGGLAIHVQRPPTARGTGFVNMEDETGMTNIIVPAWLFDRSRTTIADHAGLMVRGSVERADGAMNIVAHRLEPLRIRALPQRRR